MNQYQPYYQPGSVPFSNNMMGQYGMPYGQAPMMQYPQSYPNQMGAMAGMAGAATMAGMNGLMGGMGQINQLNNLSQAGNGLSRLTGAFRGFNYAGFLDGTQKTLTTINQIIPLVYQVTPMIKNASTMFRVANEVKRMSAQPATTATSVPDPIIIEQEVEQEIPRSAEQPTYF